MRWLLLELTASASGFIGEVMTGEGGAPYLEFLSMRAPADLVA
jgi:hypothetical protein